MANTKLFKTTVLLIAIIITSITIGACNSEQDKESETDDIYCKEAIEDKLEFLKMMIDDNQSIIDRGLV